MSDHALQRRWYALSDVDYKAVFDYHQSRQEMDLEPTEEEDGRHQLAEETPSDPDMDPSEWDPIWWGLVLSRTATVSCKKKRASLPPPARTLTQGVCIGNGISGGIRRFGFKSTP
jgi:hypothetical protein